MRDIMVLKRNPLIINNEIQATSFNKRVYFLVLHYTAGHFNESIKTLTTKVSSHYLVPDFEEPDYVEKFHGKQQVFSLVDEQNRAWHAGVSGWESHTNLNDSSIGIEIVNNTSYNAADKSIHFLPFPDSQIDAVIELCQDILKRHPQITQTRVVGHSDITPIRKNDPGPTFPWKKLHDNGIGAWFDKNTKNTYEETFSNRLPSIEDVQKKLRKYGYLLRASGEYDEQTNATIRAVQMHFRQKDYSGKLDAETTAIVYALVDKYFPENNKI